MTDTFSYQNNILCAENISLARIAEQFGTPCFVYSQTAMTDCWKQFSNAFGEQTHQICYAVKANSNLAVLNTFARLGSGFDIVSGGELKRVLAAHGDPQKVVFSGVGKTHAEIEQALQANIYCFNVESSNELQRINSVAKKLNKIADVALRLNPDVDAGTHPYISTGLKDNKFGIAIDDLNQILSMIKQLKHINLIGLTCHIGSQLTELSPFIDALDHLVKLFKATVEQGFQLKHIDIGGGLGVRYQDETPPSIEEYVQAILKPLKELNVNILIEPGRAIIANAGVLLTRVEYLKKTSQKNFAIVDGAMNDLIRPALYDAWQNILPVTNNAETAPAIYDIVGPVCESGDFLGKERQLALQEMDLLAIYGAGAYGFTMSSNYNTRPRAAEVMVAGDKAHLIRAREAVADLYINEFLIPEA